MRFMDAMSQTRSSRLLAQTGPVALGLILAIGVFWSFQRDAGDFSVFYAAWKAVLRGEGLNVYYATPDRFLYAPGFAWLLAPLGLLPRTLALVIWNLLKVLTVFATIRGLARSLQIAPGLAAWAGVLVARPLLIDFQYGQVNVLLYGICIWSLLQVRDWFSLWFLLGFSAVSKVIALPLMLLPWLRASAGRARIASLLGALAALLLPVISLGFSGDFKLLQDWKTALQNRGLPLESHNQSFAALLHHYFSDGYTTYFAIQARIPTGWKWLSQDCVMYLAFAWAAIIAASILWVIFNRRAFSPGRWAALVAGLLILPSHLIWKPYFVFSLGLAAVAIADLSQTTRHFKPVRPAILLIAFVLMNLTGFDFLGRSVAGPIEAASIFLVAHGLLIALALMGIKNDRLRIAARAAG